MKKTFSLAIFETMCSGWILYFTLFLLSIIGGSISDALTMSCASVHARSLDKYTNYSELARNEVEGRDFRIVVSEVGSAVTFIAPHAGLIEYGTSEIARELAGSSYNLYLFEGVKLRDNFSLHITSAHFDEPKATKIMAASELGISIHGYKDDSVDAILIGGMNIAVGAAISKSLRDLDIAIEFPSKKFKGDSADNIVNKARKNGVQLEISSKLRRSLISNPQKLRLFVNAVRTSL